MINIGVLGAGHLGKIHLKLLKQSQKFKLVGFFDPNGQNANAVAQEFGYKSFSSISELIDNVDVVDIVTPTINHFECAKTAIEKGKHIFIEKPIAYTTEQATAIMQMLENKNLKGQVGHVERFNPAFIAAKDHITNPMFIEAHRLAEFNPRGTDVPVVLDLMIHDIDTILSIVKYPIKNIEASGVNIISSTPDIANARLEFQNGCVANVTASRISMKNMRKTRIFQKDAYVSVDFLEKKVEIVRIKEAPTSPSDFDMIIQNAEGYKKQIYFEYPQIPTNNAILDELETFADAINNNTTPLVTIEQGTQDLKVAKQIVEIIAKNNQK